MSISVPMRFNLGATYESMRRIDMPHEEKKAMAQHCHQRSYPNGFYLSSQLEHGD
jgi:hypothetical protein